MQSALVVSFLKRHSAAGTKSIVSISAPLTEVSTYEGAPARNAIKRSRMISWPKPAAALGFIPITVPEGVVILVGSPLPKKKDFGWLHQ